MKKTLVKKSEIKLVGMSLRTNNKNEMNPETSKIAGLAGKFWSEQLAEKIMNRKNGGVTFSVYTEFDSDEHGDYTYFIGEEVDSFENIPAAFCQLIIAPTTYQKFTTEPGKMPEVVINAWQQIWQMTANDLDGRRIYQADFEVYDQRAHDPMNTIVDIYIGIHHD